MTDWMVMLYHTVQCVKNEGKSFFIDYFYFYAYAFNELLMKNLDKESIEIVERRVHRNKDVPN